MILIKYIESYLKESLKVADISYIEELILKLNKVCEETFVNLSNQGDESYYYEYIFGYLDNVVYENKPRVEELSEGFYRRAYAISGEDWVLKVSMSKEGAKINKKEIEISQGKHGLAAREIFLKVYDYDKFSELPCWIICQKVIPITYINDLNVLKKAFPTFWNMIKEGDVHKSAGFHFRNMICMTLTLFGEHHSKDVSLKRAFYDAASATCELYDFNDIVFYDDFKRISTGFSYISSSDMNEGNFGLVSLNNPSPESIVILDFDADFHIGKFS